MAYKYPIYKKAKYRVTNDEHITFVVKFTGPSTGEVIKAINEPSWKVGDTNTSFIEHYETDHWEDYPNPTLKTYKIGDYNA